MHVAERLSHCREAALWRLDRFALSVAALFHQAATVRLDEERRDLDRLCRRHDERRRR